MLIPLLLVLFAVASYLAGKALFDRQGEAMQMATVPNARNYVWQLAGVVSVAIGLFLSLGRQAVEPQPGTLLLTLALTALAIFFLASFGQTLSRARAR
ncbi:MAG: hypothetical protein ACXIUL_08070 [Wenzhouxiangella sp.]